MPRYVQNFGEYSVKNVKSFLGMEGYGFNCNLYRGKKKIGFCMDDASGGGMYPIDWLCNDAEEEQRLLTEHIATLPPVPSELNPNNPLRIDEGWFVEELVSKWEEEKDERKMRKQCQTKTLYKLRSDNEGRYWTWNVPFNQLAKSYLQTQHGDNLAEIINERFQ